MAKKQKALDAEGNEVEVEVVTNADGDTLLPGMPEPEPVPELWDVTRTFRVAHDVSRLESEAIEQGRPCRHLGKLTVTFTSKQSDVPADNAEDAIRIGCGTLDDEVMSEDEFASNYPGGEVLTTVKAKRVQAAKQA